MTTTALKNTNLLNNVHIIDTDAPDAENLPEIVDPAATENIIGRQKVSFGRFDVAGGNPTIAELQAGGYDNGYFWASEQYDSVDALVLDYGYVSNDRKNGSSDVVCVGK